MGGFNKFTEKKKKCNNFKQIFIDFFNLLKYNNSIYIIGAVCAVAEAELSLL